MLGDRRLSEHTHKETDNTYIGRSWRLGGPMTPVQRKEAKRLFIEALQRDPSVSAACRHAKIGRKTAYQWRDKDAEFADEWEDAVAQCHDEARSSIYQRGIVGWDEPVISMGQVVYEMEPVLDEEGKQLYDKGKPLMKRSGMVTIHKWSDSLAVAFAKANLREYKDKPQVNINTELADLAEQTKNALLADLAASMTDEDKN